MKQRIIAALLVMALILGLSSCKNKEKDNNDGDESVGGGLSVEVEALEYTEDDISSASSEIADLTRELARVFGYSDQVDNDDVEKTVSTFKEEVVPILIDVKIYPSELTDIFACVRECVALADGDDEYSSKMISDMYTKFAAILDADRLGAFVYEMQLLTFEIKSSNARDKYDKLGYLFYLEDAKYYDSLSERAKALGRDDFASALSVIVFTASSFNGSASFEGDGVTISASDSIAIMKKQAEKFASLSLDEADWQTVAEMCETFIPKNFSDDLGAKVLTSLEKSDFFIKAASVMPGLVKFYSAVTADVSSESISLVENAAEYAYVRAVCSEIIKNEVAFTELLAVLEENIPAASEECVNTVKIYKKSAYNEFCEKYDASAPELILAMKSFVSDPTEHSYECLADAFIGYSAHLNTVVAFVYLYS